MKKIIVIFMLMVSILLYSCPTTPKNKNKDAESGVSKETLKAIIWEDDSQESCASGGGNVQKTVLVFTDDKVYYPDFSDATATLEAECTDAKARSTSKTQWITAAGTTKIATYSISDNTITFNTVSLTYVSDAGGKLTVTAGNVGTAGLGIVFTKLD